MGFGFSLLEGQLFKLSQKPLEVSLEHLLTIFIIIRNGLLLSDLLNRMNRPPFNSPRPQNVLPFTPQQ